MTDPEDPELKLNIYALKFFSEYLSKFRITMTLKVAYIPHKKCN